MNGRFRLFSLVLAGTIALLGNSLPLFAQSASQAPPRVVRTVLVAANHGVVQPEIEEGIDRLADSLRRRLELLDGVEVVTNGAADAVVSVQVVGGELDYRVGVAGATPVTVVRDPVATAGTFGESADVSSRALSAVFEALPHTQVALGEIEVVPEPSVVDLIVSIEGTLFPAGRYALADLPAGRYQIEVLEPRFGKLKRIHTQEVVVERGLVGRVDVRIPRFLPAEQARFSRLFTFVHEGMTGGVSYTMGETAAGMLLAYAENSHNIPGLEAWRREVRALATTFRVFGAYSAVLADYANPTEDSLFSANSLEARRARLPDPEVAATGLVSVYEAYAYLNVLHAAGAVARGDPAAARERYEAALAVEAKVSPAFAARLHREYRYLRRAAAAYEAAQQAPRFTPWHGAGLAVAAGGAAAAVLAGGADRDGTLLLSAGVSLTAVVTTLASIVRRATAPERIIEETLVTVLPGRAEAADRVLGSSRAPSTRTMNTLIADYREGR